MKLGNMIKIADLYQATTNNVIFVLPSYVAPAYFYILPQVTLATWHMVRLTTRVLKGSHSIRGNQTIGRGIDVALIPFDERCKETAQKTWAMVFFILCNVSNLARFLSIWLKLDYT